MEAASMSFLSPGVLFAPTDDDLVLHYLLPSLRGRDLTSDADGLLLHADPFAAPPRDDALFLVLSSKRPRGDTGAWTKRGTKKGATVSADGEAIAWRRETLSYGPDGDRWLMHRFRVVGGKGQDMVLCRVKNDEPTKKKRRGGQEPPATLPDDVLAQLHGDQAAAR